MPLVLFYLRLKFQNFILNKDRQPQQSNKESKDNMGTMCVQSKTLCPS